MINKTTMPEPVVLRTVMPNDYRYGHVYGYTASQMRTYANERVREALLYTEDAIITLYESNDLPYLLDITRVIRELIPEEQQK